MNTLNLRSRSAFTLLELATVIVIIAILVVLLFPMVRGMRERANRMKCTQNLKSLYVAGGNYLQANHAWPQFRPAGKPDISAYEKFMFEAFRPWGAEPAAWICPSIQHNFHNPDYTDPENFRVDYIPSPFGDGESTPFRWATQPWFAEKSDMHGDGPLLVFSSGNVLSLRDVVLGKK